MKPVLRDKIALATILIIALLTAIVALAKDYKKEDVLCEEITLPNNLIPDIAISLYYQKEQEWAPLKVPDIFTCPLSDIQDLKKDAEAIYVDGMILVSKESGIMDGENYAWSLVIHELVHHLQYLDGKMTMVEAGQILECELENDAYAVQKKFLDYTESKWTIEYEDQCK